MPVTRRFARLLPAAMCAIATPTILHAQTSTRSAGRVPSTSSLPRTWSGGPTRQAISAADLMTRVYKFADDSMMGREASTEYNAKGAMYIESELRRLGLEPAGEDGFFQYPVVNTSTDAARSALSVDGSAFRLWADFAPRNQGPGARSFDGMQAVYAGSLGDSATLIPASAGAGKVVVITLARDSAGNRVWNVNRAQITARYPEAAAIAVVQIDYTPRGYVEQVYASQQLGVRRDAPATSAPGRVQPGYLYVTNAVARAMLGADADGVAPGTAGRTVRGAVRFGETRAPGRNVVAILRGSDAVLRNQYVAIGAHNDHIGFAPQDPSDHDSVRAYHLVAAPQGADDPDRPATAEELPRIRTITDSLRAAHGGARLDSIFNGADDDASGSMSLLEIAEYYALARNRPKRSLIFVWHAGEEGGMLGSNYFTDHTPMPRDSIVAALNIDMIGRGGSDDITGVTKDGAKIHGGPGYVQLIGSRRLSRELGDLAETVNRTGRFGLNFDYSLDANGHPQNIYCRSDHAMYARYGIPVVFFTTGGHADYHQVTDEPQYIDYNRMERVASMISALAERVANLDHRVAVDGPKPDPRAPCQQ